LGGVGVGGATSVPEPSALILVLIGTVAGLLAALRSRGLRR
jgi:hypothetical protein